MKNLNPFNLSLLKVLSLKFLVILKKENNFHYLWKDILLDLLKANLVKNNN